MKKRTVRGFFLEGERKKRKKGRRKLSTMNEKKSDKEKRWNETGRKRETESVRV